jgi:ankyrin repeat protein
MASLDEDASFCPETPYYCVGDRILHIAASCGQTEAIEALLDSFPSLEVNQLNDHGETPLLCACRAGPTRTAL